MTTRRQLREAKRRRSRKIKALLAAGVVFGVGAGATLAAWNDSEYATATFTAGVFGVEGATNGSAFSEHPSAPGASLTLSAGFGAMVPGTDVYALFSVRTIATSVAGTVTMTADADNTLSGTLGEYLTYDVRTIAGTTCNATAFDAGANDASTAKSLSANRGNQVNYCIKVSLPLSAPNAAQGKSVQAEWTFTGESS